MSGKPAARVTDPTTCPVPGHGSNPIVQGSPDVVFDGLPAARQGDTSACGSPMISAVSSTVLINGLPAVTLGSIGAHGNVVIGGSGTVLIGDVFTPDLISTWIDYKRTHEIDPIRLRPHPHEFEMYYDC